MMYHIYSLQGFGLAGAQGDIGVHPPVSCQKPGHRERGTSMLSVWLLVSLIPKTLSPLTSSALCWIDIVDIAMLIRYRVYIVMIVIISRMSKLQCWYDIEFASLSSLSFPVCRHRNVDTISSLHRHHRYHFPYVDIAMLIRYRVCIVIIVIISRMSTSQCWYNIEFASLSSLSFPVCRHRRHCRHYNVFLTLPYIDKCEQWHQNAMPTLYFFVGEHNNLCVKQKYICHLSIRYNKL